MLRRRTRRTGIRLWTHLPRWRLSPRAWSLAVVVTEGGRVVADIEAIDHRPAFVALAPGAHELEVSVMTGLRTAAKFPLAVTVRADEVLDYELIRPRRRAVGRRNVPTGVRRKT